MTDSQSPAVGTIAWRDLTVSNADVVRDFSRAVVGWQAEPLDMGGYADFVMKAPGGEAVAGEQEYVGVFQIEQAGGATTVDVEIFRSASMTTTSMAARLCSLSRLTSVTTEPSRRDT